MSASTAIRTAINSCKKMEMSERVRNFMSGYLSAHAGATALPKYGIKASIMNDESIVCALGEDFDTFWEVLELRNDRKQEFVDTIFGIIIVAKELRLEDLEEVNLIILAKFATDVGIDEFTKLLPE